MARGGLCALTTLVCRTGGNHPRQGHKPQAVFSRTGDKYKPGSTWGSSYVPSEIASAFLWGQLEQLEPIAARRRKIYDFYHEQLAPLEAAGLLRLPRLPEECQTNYHLFYVLLQDGQTRDALLAYLKEQGIQAVVSLRFLCTHRDG